MFFSLFAQCCRWLRFLASNLFQRSNLCGVDTASNCLRIAKLSRRAGRYRLEEFAINPVATNKTRSKKIRNAVAALPYSKITATKVELDSSIQENEIEEFLNLNLEQLVNYPAEQACFDYWVERGSRSIVNLVATPKSCAQEHINSLSKFEFNAEILEVDAHALALAATRLLPDQQAPYALINLEVGTMLLSVIWQSKLIYAKESCLDILQCGGESQSLPGAENAHITAQIKRNLQICLDAIGRPIIKIVLAGMLATRDGLARAVTEQTMVVTEIADPLALITIASRIDKSEAASAAPAMLLCLGLALRDRGCT